MTEPCGTPTERGVSVDVASLILQYCVRVHMYSNDQLMRLNNGYKEVYSHGHYRQRVKIVENNQNILFVDNVLRTCHAYRL